MRHKALGAEEEQTCIYESLALLQTSPNGCFWPLAVHHAQQLSGRTRRFASAVDLLITINDPRFAAD
jgi:hypothetical protein